MNEHMRWLAFCCAPWVLLGCDPMARTESTGGSAASDEIVAVQTFQCGDLRIEAQFTQDQAFVTLPDRDLTLPNVAAASGARYSDGRDELWTQGLTSALLTLEGAETVECTATEGRSPWAAARERGVYFRAVGNEPAWSVEVDEGQNPAMRLLLDFGQRPVEFASTQPLSSPQGFLGTDGDVSAELRIVTEACADTMVEVVYPATATLSFEGRTLIACGRFLR